MASGCGGDSDGTDMVPLLGENRTLVYYGTKGFEENSKVGTAFFLSAIEIVGSKHSGGRFEFYDSAKA